jgi:hypothetical protein
MWKRREPADPEPVDEEAQPAPPPATRPVTEQAVGEETDEEAAVPEAALGRDDDDPYAQLENFFNEPLVLEDTPASQPGSPQAPPPPPPSPPTTPASPVQGPAIAGLSETVERLEQFGRRLATRFEALEVNVQEGSAQTLEALRRLGERMGAELAMLDKRAVNLELTMARLRATTEALELSLRKLPDLSGPEANAEESSGLEGSTSAGAAPDPVVPPIELPRIGPNEDPRPDAPPPGPAGALFTLEEEVPSDDWDELPPDDSPPAEPTWP